MKKQTKKDKWILSIKPVEGDDLAFDIQVRTRDGGVAKSRILCMPKMDRSAR